jgi:hypothetical protein
MMVGSLKDGFRRLQRALMLPLVGATIKIRNDMNCKHSTIALGSHLHRT